MIECVKVAMPEVGRGGAQLEVRPLRPPARPLAGLEGFFPKVSCDLWRCSEIADRENDVTFELFGATTSTSKCCRQLCR
jgi:hypothetical protein